MYLIFKEYEALYILALLLNFRWYQHQPASLDVRYVTFEKSVECILLLEREYLGIKIR